MTKYRKDLTIFKKFLLDNFGFVAQLEDQEFPFQVDTVNGESSLSYISFQSEKDA